MKNLALILAGLLLGFCLFHYLNKETFRNSEFERGAKFTINYHHDSGYYPSYGLREHVFINPDIDWDTAITHYEAHARVWYNANVKPNIRP